METTASEILEAAGSVADAAVADFVLPDCEMKVCTRCGGDGWVYIKGGTERGQCYLCGGRRVVPAGGRKALRSAEAAREVARLRVLYRETRRALLAAEAEAAAGDRRGRRVVREASRRLAAIEAALNFAQPDVGF